MPQIIKHRKPMKPRHSEHSHVIRRFGLRRASRAGQSLIEILIGIGVATIFVIGIIGVLVLTLRIHFQSKSSQVAGELTGGIIDQVRVVAEADWHALFDISPHDGTTPFHIETSGNFLTIVLGAETVSETNQVYTRWFTIADVSRDSADAIVSQGGTVDPSTLLITSHSSWGQGGSNADVSFSRYLTRSKDRVFNQTDWSAGPSQEGPINPVNASFSTSSNINYASSGQITITDLSAQESSSTNSNIDTADHWAWNDVIGWIDFRNTNSVTVSSTQLWGYASSGVGFIALDCATAPVPDCTHSYKIYNDGSGNLSGYAWNDAIGWLSFAATGPSPSYGVTIDQDGNFWGYAWNDVVGWFSFNCGDTGACATSAYKTKTTWSITVVAATLTSSIFDTQIVGGAAYNSIMWQGTQPTGTHVKFQIATANDSSGPWNYYGSDGTNSTYYEPAGPNVQLRISRDSHNNQRYVRYKIILESDPSKIYTPLVSDIIINWSP